VSTASARELETAVLEQAAGEVLFELVGSGGEAAARR
jgi:hypothetical protein